MRKAMMPTAATVPASRITVSAGVASAVRPSVVVNQPTTLPSAVVGESQVRTPDGVPNAAESTPLPASVRRKTLASVLTRAIPANAHDRMRSTQRPSRPDHSRPTKGSAMMAMGFTATARLTTTAPQIHRCWAASARPATTSPTIRASLCAPLMKCMSTIGLSTPSHRARSASMPCSRARTGT
jgi:hypothetical protein